MVRSVTFESYAPALYGDDEFVPSVTALVRDHLDESGSRSGVVSRTTNKLIPIVTNRAVVFQDPRYYFGRVCVPDTAHNTSKLDSIRRASVDNGMYTRHAGGLLEISLDTIEPREIDTPSGKKTLLVATSSRRSDENTEEHNVLGEYTDEVVASTNALLARRKSMQGAEFNGLNGTIPIVSLGFVAIDGVDIDLLVKNIGELVEEPMQSIVAIPYDGLVTKLAN